MKIGHGTPPARPGPVRLTFLVLNLMLGFLVGFGCNAPSPHVDAEIRDRNVVIGSIFDDFTGGAILGADVNLGRAPEDFEFPRPGDRLTPGTIDDPTAYPRPTPVLRGVTDSDGKFRIDGVPQGHFRLEVSAPGFFTHVQPLLLAMRSTQSVAIGLLPLDESGSIRGTLVDATTGIPIPDVRATLISVDIVVNEMHSFTDALGNFELGPIPMGRARVKFVKNGYRTTEASVTIDRGVVTILTFYLPLESARVTGIIQSDRSGGMTPLENAQVSVLGTPLTTLSGADGRYELTGIPEGLDAFRFSAFRHDDETATTTIAASRSISIDAILRYNRASIQGQILDGTNQPVPAAIVTIPAQVLTTSTGLDGAYSFLDSIELGNPPDPIQIGVIKPGFVQVNRTVILQPDQLATVNVVLDRATGDFNGQVLESGSDLAVPGARVALPSLALSRFTDGLGAFAFTTIPAGSFQVDVTATGFSPVTTFVFVPPTASVTATIHVTH